MKNEMLKIGLVSMPQAVTKMPSIGLTQLSSVVKKKFAGRVKTSIIYANLDFVEFIGFDNYMKIEAGGLTEWMFRREAFPRAYDNTADVQEYFFAGGKTPLKAKTLEIAAEKSKDIRKFLDELISQYDLLQYDVVGFTAVVYQNIASFALAGRIKDKKPSIITVMGGSNCEFPMGRVIIDNIDQVDYVFSGPAINSFPVFIEHLLSDNITGTHQIDGVFSKKNKVANSSPGQHSGGAEPGGPFWVNPRGDYHDIDTCIDLKYDGFLDKYESFSKAAGTETKPVLLFETSMGCWKRDKLPCTFCGMNNPASCYAAMRADLAVDYMSNLIGKYSNRCSIFSGVDCIIGKKYIKDVLPRVKKTANVILHYESRSNLTKDEMTICADSGAKILQPGIESLNSPVLKLMQKGIDAFNNIRFLKGCIETGIYPIWNLLYGLPDERGDSSFKKLLKDLPLLRHLPPPAAFVPIFFVRYSQYFEKANQYGLKLRPDPRYSLLYPFEEKDLFNLAYTFVDTNPGAGYIKVSAAYTQMIGMEIVIWMSRFRNTNNFPALYIVNDGTIFDSRFDEGSPAHHTISPLEKEMIDFLGAPRKLDGIKDKFSHVPGKVFNDGFDSLNKKGLLFAENDRYISLVCSGFSWRPEDYLEMNRFIALTTAEAF